MSFQSKVYLPDIKECLGVKEISTNHIKKIFERIKKSQSTEVAKLKIDKSKLIFVPFIYLEFDINSNYEYEAADEREEPYTDYVEKSRSIPYTDTVQKSRSVPYTDYERRINVNGGDDITPVTRYRTEYYTAPVTRYRTEYYTVPVTKYRTIEFNHRRIQGSKTKIYEGDGTYSAKGISTTFKNDKSDKSYLLNFTFDPDATRKFGYFEYDSQFSKNEIENWIYDYTGCNKEKIETEIIQFDISSAINKIKDEDIRDELLAEIEDEDAQGDVNRNYQVSFSKSLKKAKIVYLPIFVQRCKTSDDILFYEVVNIRLAKSDDKNRGTKVFPDSKTTEYLLKKSKKARGYNFYRHQYILPLYIFLTSSILNILLRIIFTKIGLVNDGYAYTMIGDSLSFNEQYFSSPTILFIIFGTLLLLYNWLFLANKEKTQYVNQNKEIFNLKENLLLKSNVESLFSGCDLKTTGFEIINNVSPRKIKIIKKSFSINNLIIYFSSSVLFFDLIFSFFSHFFFYILFIWFLLTGYLFLGNWNNSGKLLSKKVSWTTTRTNLFFKYFAKYKKTINKFFIVFSVILSLVLGNEVRKSYPFYKEDKKVPESKKSNSKIKIETRSLDDAKAYFNRGFSKYKKGDYSGAIVDYTKAIKLDPNYSLAYGNRGVSKYNKGDYSGAIVDYTKAIKLNPNYSLAYSNRGGAKQKLADYSGAIDDYTKAIKLNPNYSFVYSNRGGAKHKLSDYSGAIDDFTKAIKLDPNNSEAYTNLGVTKDKIGDYSGAIDDYTYAIKLRPNDEIAYSNRGRTKIKLKDYKSACEDFKIAIRLGNRSDEKWFSSNCKN